MINIKRPTIHSTARWISPGAFLSSIKTKSFGMIETARYIISFSFLLTIYLIAQAVRFVGRVPFIPQAIKLPLGNKLGILYKRLIAPTGFSEKTINRLNLIELAIRNMSYKKTRSIITIGGMAVGIGAIVFLVSIGFGLQELVVGRVARLDELKQADVAIQTGSKLFIDDKTMNDISLIPEVEKVLPLVAVVGRISYNKSISDVAVFGVTSDYLKNSAVKPVNGRIFNNNDLRVSLPKSLADTDEDVQGAGSERVLAKYGEKIQDIDFVIEQETWLPVREGPTAGSKLLGYTRRVPGTQIGEEYWGDSYVSDDGSGSAGTDADGNELGKWIRSTFRLWSKEICLISENPDCEENQYVVLRNEEGSQAQAIGYTIERNMSVRETIPADYTIGKVLGESTDGHTSVGVMADGDVIVDGDVLAEQVASASPRTYIADSTDADESTESALLADSLDTGELINSIAAKLDIDASSAALLQQEGVIENGTDPSAGDKEVKIADEAVREAIVNRAALNILGIDEKDAVGKTFEISFVVVDRLTEGDERIRSVPTEYTIVGIDPGEDTPFLYVPFIDLRSLGVSKYSQLRVIVEKEEVLPEVRQKIEVLGYATTSVVDTVARITSFFGTLRIVLALLGGVALAVASLGMFNTLTVSLLERTREVGLMKAMGMKSYEVRELFLTESMIMGFFGGLLGIIIGVGTGQLLSLLLTAFAITKGAGIISISYTPVIFIVLTMLFAMFVGLITGIYPARRATSISALNALRYE